MVEWLDPHAIIGEVESDREGNTLRWLSWLMIIQSSGQVAPG